MLHLHRMRTALLFESNARVATIPQALTLVITSEPGACMTEGKNPTLPEALDQWRAAERLAAVARRGHVAAQAAVLAAEEAADAAVATAEAAKSALEAMALAQQSAAKTAATAKHVALTLQADLADSEAATAMADIDESAAQSRYQDASKRASQR